MYAGFYGGDIPEEADASKVLGYYGGDGDVHAVEPGDRVGVLSVVVGNEYLC